MHDVASPNADDGRWANVTPLPVRRRRKRWPVILAVIFTVLLMTCWISAVVSGHIVAWLAAIFTTIVIGLVSLRLARGSLEDAEAEMRHVLRTPPQPSRRVARNLADGEELVWETREHPIVLLKWWLACGSASIAAITLMSTGAFVPGLVVLAGAVLFACGKLYHWQENRLALTTTRLFMAKGLISVSYPMMPLNKLTDARLHIPWHSSILAHLRIVYVRYGSLKLESPGQWQALYRVAFSNALAFNLLTMGLINKK